MTKNPKKQRKRFFEGALHESKRLIGTHLSKELRKELKKRSITARVGDSVKIMRGDNRGKSGKITGVEKKRSFVFIDSIKRKKTNGKEVFVPVRASNIVVTELNRDDEKRFKRQKVSAKKEQK